MNERSLAGQLALLATEVDSLEKRLVQAQAERARETERRNRSAAEAEQLREQLRHARRRAHTAERELAKLSAGVEAATHTAQVREHELQTRLDDALQTGEQLRQQLERNERQRHALEVNLRQVMENLRNAAQEAQGSGATPAPLGGWPEEETLVPVRRGDSGW
jgi:chromosome segregation ATPase